MEIYIHSLDELASIRFGEVIPGWPDPDLKGNVRLIRMGDLNSDGTQNMESAARIRIDKPRDTHILRQGDLICRTRGVRNFTTNILDEEPDMPTILAAPLIRLRVVDPKRVHPGYLFWWINRPESQRFLNAKSEGTSVKMISKRVLRELTVALPPLGQQRVIARVASLALREQTLHHQIAVLRAQYTHGLLSQLVHETQARSPRTIKESSALVHSTERSYRP